MKKFFLEIVLVVLISTSTMYAQSLSDYIKQVKGDTLVVKTYDDMGGMPDALYYTLLQDTVNVTAGRVYELQAGGWYPLQIIPLVPQNTPRLL